MTIRRIISVFFAFVIILLTISSVIVVFNFREFKKNKHLQNTIHLTIQDLENTTLLLDEFFVNPNKRVLLQLRLQTDSFYHSKSFESLEEFKDTFDLIIPLTAKRRDFLTVLDNFYILLEREPLRDEIMEETASLLFVISHEMKSYMSALHGQAQRRIARDNLILFASFLILQIVLSGLLLFVLIWLHKGFLGRILRMDRLAGNIAHGDYSKYLPIERNDELTGLARSFNVMQNAIREQMDNLAGERDKFSIILSSIGDAVLAVDVSGKIYIMNPVAEYLTGWKFSEAVGRSFHEIARIFNSATREPVKNSLQRVLDTGEQYELLEQKTLVCRTGEEFLIHDSAAPVFNRDGEITGAVLVFRDITDQIHLQEVMVQTEKMVSIGELAAGVAKEIAAPLTDMTQTITGVLESLSLDNDANQSSAAVADLSRAKVHTFLSNKGTLDKLLSIKESAAWVMRILEKMLMFAGNKTESKRSSDITELLDNTLELARSDYELRNMYDFRKIIIVRDYAKELPKVLCDPSGLQQVFLNIIRNGVQSMYAAKTDPPRFFLRVYKDEERRRVCVEISDNGPGMDESVRKRVFEPFFTTSQKGKGRGLGLSIAYFIITDNHDGEIEVRSTPGVGARFIMQLPYGMLEQ